MSVKAANPTEPAAQLQGVELLHWRFRSGVEETMCGLSVWVAATLLPEAATCPLCKAAFFGYKLGRADLPRATTDDGSLLTALKAAANYICRARSDHYDAETRDTVIKALTYEINELERVPRATGETTVENRLVDEVQHRMDLVVERAVDWHEAGREGTEWFDKAEALSAAIDSLLELRAVTRTEGEGEK